MLPYARAGYIISEATQGLRDQIYCDQSLDGVLAGLRLQEPLLQEAAGAIAQGRIAHACALLEDSAAQLKYGQQVSYWFVLIKARWMDGNLPGARDAVLHLLAVPTLSAREKLQGWAIWREFGYFPDQRDADRVLGLVLEIGAERGVVIVAGYADGDARLLWTSSGGLLVPMRDPEVFQAAREATRMAEPLTALLRLDTLRPLPGRGRVRVTVLTPGGMHTAEEQEPSLQQPGHRLYPTYRAMHRLLNGLIRVQEERKKGGGSGVGAT